MKEYKRNWETTKMHVDKHLLKSSKSTRTAYYYLLMVTCAMAFFNIVYILTHHQEIFQNVDKNVRTTAVTKC